MSATAPLLVGQLHRLVADLLPDPERAQIAGLVHPLFPPEQVSACLVASLPQEVRVRLMSRVLPRVEVEA